MFLIKHPGSKNRVTTESPKTGQRIIWRSLTFQLLAIVVFPLIVLLLIITFGSTTLHENAMRDLVSQRDERAARMASTAIEDQLQKRANEVRALAGQVSNAAISQASEVLLSASYLNTDFDASLAFFRKNGEMIAVQGDPSIWERQAPALTEGLSALAKDPNSSVYFSKVLTQSGQRGPLMIVMASTANNQSILAGAFYTQPLIEHVSGNVFTPDQEVSVVVVDSGGIILYQKGFDTQVEVISRHVGVAEALAGKFGTTYKFVDSSEHVVAYGPVNPIGWALLIEEPWERVTSPLLNTTHIAPLVMVPIALLSLLAIFFGIRQIVQPLQALANQSGSLGWGDYKAIEKPVGGISEIRQLQMELVYMARKVSAAQQNLHSFIGAITSGQEEERRRLARELHDDTIQSLIAFKQRVQLVEMDWEGHPVVKALSELENLAEQTIENLRRMISALRPIYLEDLGLVAAVNMLATDTVNKLGSPVDFIRQGTIKRLEAPIELALYRIVQEALSNITRHSEATYVSIKMTFQPDGIKISIEDNGKGFIVPRSPSEFAPNGHFGLLGIFERADLIGGEIQVDSSPGQGTRLVVTVLNPLLQEIKKEVGISGLISP